MARGRDGREARGPVPMLPVAQLYARDLPLPGPSGADLLQVLWCPFDHGSQPRTALYWRVAAEVSRVLDAPPEPSAIQYSFYLPEPCLLAPEQVVEYPHPLELSGELQEWLADPGTWEAAGVAVPARSDEDDYDEDESVSYDFYRTTLSISPGWKVGGWTRWGLTDPQPRSCPECGTEEVPLLTIASTEWNASSRNWMPLEERSAPTRLLPRSVPAGFTQVTLAHGYDLQIHMCPASPEHPRIELIQ
ncbi:non-ribosomal peptide synthetase [Streptomyces sp. SPB074]|uniref:non-ribosomal peptide synthetase n=1 Tax=Streptomyces sp. (strain SPB074) TaxID=465543 RepID=UPI001F3D0DEC|nr:non-ribosomal peptide synthetase [Streptomyces sp. SPB074]